MLQVRRIRNVGSGAAACLAILAAAACGSPGDGAAPVTGGEGADVAKAKAALESFRAGESESPPTTAPKPQPGKNVWIVTYGLASTPAVEFDLAAKDAAAVMGWETTSCDGRFSPDQWQQCYRQAIAAGADGLAIYVNDCASTQTALREVQAANIITVSAEAADCDDQQQGAEPLFDAQVEFAQGTFRDLLAELLEPSAAYVVSELGAEARIILVNETGNYGVGIMTDGVKKYLGELCPGCQIVDTVEYTPDEMGAPLQAKIGQALLKNPGANAVIAPYDDVAQSVVPAVRESGRSGDIIVTAGPGNDATLDFIRAGDVAGGYANDVKWEGWATMDALNRLFNGEEPKSSGMGITWMDAENVPVAGEEYKSPFDFEAIYTKALTGGGE